jgi:hypothetical protein
MEVQYKNQLAILQNKMYLKNFFKKCDSIPKKIFSENTMEVIC